MPTPPVGRTRSMAPSVAVAGLCALGVGLLVLTVSVLGSALEAPTDAVLIPPRHIHSGPGITLQPRSNEPPAAPEEASEEAQLVALAPAAEVAARTPGDDVSPSGRSDARDGKSKPDRGKDDDGKPGTRSLSSKGSYQGPDASKDGPGKAKARKHGKGSETQAKAHGKGQGKANGKGHGKGQGKGRGHGKGQKGYKRHGRSHPVVG